MCPAVPNTFVQSWSHMYRCRSSVRALPWAVPGDLVVGWSEDNPVPPSCGKRLCGEHGLCSPAPLRAANSGYRAKSHEILQGKSCGIRMQGNRANSKLVWNFSSPSACSTDPGQAGAAAFLMTFLLTSAGAPRHCFLRLDLQSTAVVLSCAAFKLMCCSHSTSDT